MRSTYVYHVRHRNGWGTGFGPRPTHCHECGADIPPSKGDGDSGLLRLRCLKGRAA